MLDFLRDAHGVRLTEEEYDEDFDQRWNRSSGFDRWKLERRQHFMEPWDESWQAFARGDWREVLRLGEASADEVLQEGRQTAARGIRRLRVRVVEMPITPYMQWELHEFQYQVAAGEQIRVVAPDVIAPFEVQGPVPELVNVGTETLYETVYDTDGLGIAGIRFTGTDVVSGFRAFMESLFAQGEDFTDFYIREVAPLPPPPVTGG